MGQQTHQTYEANLGWAGYRSRSAAASVGAEAGWLCSKQFDTFFIVGIAALAIAVGLMVVIEPILFIPILAVDLWFLGCHHVVSTFTRLCFDAQSFRQHRFLIFGLPVLALFTVVILASSVGLWTITTLYLYWQWFHYTRQSWGVAQGYRRKAQGLVVESQAASQSVFYLLPLWGILSRSHQAPDLFLGIELRVIPVAGVVVDVVGVAALAALGWWAFGRLSAWRRGQLPVAHTLYLLSHFAVFLVGYVLIEEINTGWLVVNVWHNTQYIAFVWLHNNNRFRMGIDPAARFLSTISQQRNLWFYLAVCFGVSTFSYLFAIGSVATAVFAPIILFQTANFHHYIVDGLIWKSRRKPEQRSLRLAS